MPCVFSKRAINKHLFLGIKGIIRHAAPVTVVDVCLRKSPRGDAFQTDSDKTRRGTSRRIEILDTAMRECVRGLLSMQHHHGAGSPLSARTLCCPELTLIMQE